MPSPVFVVSNVGLANTYPNPANPNQVVINITDFEVGSAYGTTALATDLDLYGNLLYGPQAPSTYALLPDGGVDIVLTVPADAGPFDYGEVAIYNTGPNGRTLFAHAVWDSPQTKYSSLETNVGSAEVFHALLRLQQSNAVFQVSTLVPVTLETVALWSDVQPPSLQVDPTIPLLRVMELDPVGDASVLINSSPGHWAVGTTYGRLFDTTLVNATTTSLVVTTNGFGPVTSSSVNCDYVVEFLDTGLFRSVNSLSSSAGTYTLQLNPAALPDIPEVGTNIRVYQANSQRLTLATNGNPGIATAGPGTIINTPGEIETHGLLHDVPGAGRLLTSSDNLNDTSLPSGIYNTHISVSGSPANLPVAQDGQLYVTYPSTAQGIVQMYYPIVGTSPLAYWRAYNNSTSSWSNWFPLGAATNNNGSLSNLVYSSSSTGSTGGSELNDFCSLAIYNIALQAGASVNAAVSAYINGMLVSNDSLNSFDPEFIGAASASVLVPKGSTFSWNVTVPGNPVNLYYSRYAVII